MPCVCNAIAAAMCSCSTESTNTTGTCMYSVWARELARTDALGMC